MQDQIICPHCNKPIPLTQALSHQMREKFQVALNENLKKKELEYQQKLQVEKAQMEVSAREKAKREVELKIQDTKNEAEELKKQNNALQTQLLDLSKLMRQLRVENEQKKLEMEKRLSEEQEKIRQEEQRRMEESYRMRMLEKDKKLQDAIVMNEELKRKLEQGSQQTQGEVLELEMEQMLKREFPYDEIIPVAKGVRGADVLQKVRSKMGKDCGVIIWETKRTKSWSQEWISKLKDDQRQAHAEIAVIITQVLPAGVKRAGLVDGIWVGDYESILMIALALRSQLQEVALVKQSSVGKNEKMEVLYTYLSGIEFKQRMEAIIEAFSSMQEDIEKEKRWFNAKWAKEEKMIRKVIDNTAGMHGDLQSIMGKAMGEIVGLAIESPEELSSGTIINKEYTLFDPKS